MGTANGMHSNNTGLFVAPFVTPDPTSGATFLAQPWQEVTDVISLNGVPLERTVTQLTHLRSPNKAQEKVPGYLDGGQLTLKLNYFKQLMSFLQTRVPGGENAPDTSPTWGRLRWAVLFPDNGVWVFTGFIKSDPIEVPEDDRATIELTVEISGKPTWFAFA